MSKFSEKEVEYFSSQRLGRLATIDATGQPHIVPVSFRYNPELDTIDIGGHGIAKSRKYHHVQANDRVSFVIDDVLPPWQPRGVEIRGRAVALAEGGKAINASFDEELLRIAPTRIINWGLDGDAFTRNARNV